MKKILLSAVLVACFAMSLFAQDPQKTEEQLKTEELQNQQNQQKPQDSEKTGFDKSRLFFGGSFGLSFGSYTLVNISPQVGYQFNNYLAAGIGINGQYSKITDDYGSYSTSTSYGVAGMNLFGRVYPIRQLFAQLQPELNYIWGKYDDGENENSLNGKILPSLLIGAGGMIPMGRSGGLMIMAQYDLLNKSNTLTDPGTPYGKNIFFSIGFNVGL